MRATLVILAMVTAAALLPRAAAAQDGHPDLTGLWKLQRPDSLVVGRAGRPPQDVRERGSFGGSPAGRLPGGPRDSTPFGAMRTITITQTDSTVTIGGERLPSHIYFTDGREEKLTLGGVATTVRARWEWGDLVVEREGDQRTTIESYRLDEKGPWLIVIVEIQGDEDSDRPGMIRLHRIYDREEPPGPAPPQEPRQPHDPHGAPMGGSSTA